MTTTVNTVYFLCLVDSSLPIGINWGRLVGYLQLALQRLGQSTAESKLQLAFVTYATADTVPSPILVKLPFVDAQHVMQDWKKQDFSRLALGRTAMKKNLRTSLLEGLVASLELFDSIPPKDANARAVNRILHISATPSDDSKNPQWNVNTVFDQITWQTLPAEFQKRNIVISGVSLQENASLVDFYKSVAGESPQQPWFPVQSGHQISLFGFPPPRPLKRDPEAQTSPRDKRLRTTEPSTPTNSTNVTNSTNPANPVTASSPTKSAVQPNPPKATPQSNLGPGSQNLAQKAQTLMGQFRIVTGMITRVETEIRTAKADGNVGKLAKLEQDHLKLKERQALIMQPLNQLKAQLVSQHNSGSPAAAEAPAPADNSASTPPTQARPRPTPINPPSQETTPNPVVPNTTPSTSNTTPAPVPQPMGSANVQPPNMTAQMQKLVQQQAQTRVGVGVSGASNPSLPVPTSQNPQAKPVWQGAMVFTGPEQPNAPAKEFAVQMNAYCSSASAEYHPETWPKSIKLSSAFKPLNSPADLSPWVKRYNPLMCTLAAQDPENSKPFRAIYSFLQAKKMYTTGGWTLPSGAQKTNVLVFALGETLIGAFFPHAGVPEFSHMDLTPIVAPNPHPIPPQLMARLTALPPEQRERFLQFHLHHAQQQQMASMAPSMGVPLNSGGGVSLEMLQSFMQRKPPGVG